jgi:hypothetical protein
LKSLIMPFLFVLIVAVVVALAIHAAKQAKKRRQAMAALAAELGLHYTAEHDDRMDERYPFLANLGQGSNRYAFNVISGNYRDHDIHLFDYHYETHSTDSKGNRKTHHHYFSFFIMIVDASFPELTITREGFFSKIAQFVGYDDIDFESAEFSRRFCVRCRDKKFAYDICHARMMEYLLANDDLNVEMEAHCLTLAFSSRLAPEQIRYNLGRLMQLQQLIPEYVWQDR